MANAISAIKDQFTSEPTRTALNSVLASRGLAAIRGPIRRHRRQLRAAAGLPALAAELGRLEAVNVAAGGLRALTGELVYLLALGGADDTDLFDRLEQYIDAVREAVETTLAAGFQRLEFAGADVEGEVIADAGVSIRLVPLRFTYTWLYRAGEN